MAATWEDVKTTNLNIAKRLRSIRRKQKISQERLWLMSGVALGTIKRFERTGNISLVSLVKIVNALGRLDELKELFK